jgi:hypothetical protein
MSNFSVQTNGIANISTLNTISAPDANPVVNVISFSYNYEDINNRLTNEPFTFAQATLYDNIDPNNRTAVGYNTFSYQYQKIGLESEVYFNSLLDWNFVIGSLQNLSEPFYQPVVISGSRLDFTSTNDESFLPFSSSWTGDLTYGGNICGYYKLNINDAGRRDFTLYLTRATF